MSLRWTLEPRETRVVIMNFALDRGYVVSDELEACLQPVEPAGSALRKAEHISSRRGLSFVSLSHGAPFVADGQEVSTIPRQ